MFKWKKYGKLFKNYLCYPFLSGALIQCYSRLCASRELSEMHKQILSLNEILFHLPTVTIYLQKKKKKKNQAPTLVSTNYRKTSTRPLCMKHHINSLIRIYYTLLYLGSHIICLNYHMKHIFFCNLLKNNHRLSFG